MIGTADTVKMIVDYLSVYGADGCLPSSKADDRCTAPKVIADHASSEEHERK